MDIIYSGGAAVIAVLVVLRICLPDVFEQHKDKNAYCSESTKNSDKSANNPFPLSSAEFVNDLENDTEK